MPVDEIQIEFLADGTIKTTTPKVSGANHVNAEAFMKHLADLTGGEVTRTRVGEAHSHEHEHEQAHDHVTTGGGKK